MVGRHDDTPWLVRLTEREHRHTVAAFGFDLAQPLRKLERFAALHFEVDTGNVVAQVSR